MCVRNDIPDDVGDMLVVLIIIVKRNPTLQECLEVHGMISKTVKAKWLMVSL